MNTKLRFLPLIGAIALSGASNNVFSEVKSLSSSEMTETYIKDSTIIVAPKKKPKEVVKKTYSSLTISPVDISEAETELIQEVDDWREASAAANAEYVRQAEEVLRNADIAAVDSPLNDLQIDFTDPTFPIPNLPDDPRFQAPEGDFAFQYAGNDLGISREGEKFTFSIGNLPGVDPINLPYAVDDGPLEITPRPGGGFDLTIDIPQDR